MMERPDQQHADPSREEWGAYIAWLLSEQTPVHNGGWNTSTIAEALGLPFHVARACVLTAIKSGALIEGEAAGTTSWVYPPGYKFSRRRLTDKQFRTLGVIVGAKANGEVLSHREIARRSEGRPHANINQVLDALNDKKCLNRHEVNRHGWSVHHRYELTAIGSDLYVEEHEIRLRQEEERGSEPVVVPKTRSQKPAQTSVEWVSQFEAL